MVENLLEKEREISNLNGMETYQSISKFNRRNLLKIKYWNQGQCSIYRTVILEIIFAKEETELILLRKAYISFYKEEFSGSNHRFEFRIKEFLDEDSRSQLYFSDDKNDDTFFFFDSGETSFDFGDLKFLEKPLPPKLPLGEAPLIYGTSRGRDEISKVATSMSGLKDLDNVIHADDYLSFFNDDEYHNLCSFAIDFINNIILDKHLELIVTYFDSDSLNVNIESNKEILKKLLENEKVKVSLNTISKFYNVKNYNTPEFYDAVCDFFAEKTILILDIVLKKGGQIYFALDEIVSTLNTHYTVIDCFIDFKKLDITLFKERHSTSTDNGTGTDIRYNSVTSRELRFLYKYYRDNPNVKFTLKKQVIANPFINIEELKKISKSFKK